MGESAGHAPLPAAASRRARSIAATMSRRMAGVTWTSPSEVTNFTGRPLDMAAIGQPISCENAIQSIGEGLSDIGRKSLEMLWNLPGPFDPGYHRCGNEVTPRG